MTNKKTIKLAIFIMLSFVSDFCFSQVTPENGSVSITPALTSDNENFETRQIFKRKGNIYFYWGYPKAYYSHSDISFTGDIYDFTITDIMATDDSYKHDFTTYINPGTFSIPMYNWRVGYFINDKTFINFGQDHMKYEMKKQATYLTGEIRSGEFEGSYNHTMVVVGEDSEEAVLHTDNLDSLPGEFVAEFEHCDGLNDFGFEIGRLEQFWISKNGKNALSAQGTFGMGMMIPDSEVEVIERKPMHNNAEGRKSFHLAGYSVSASVGLQFDFFKHLFILGKLKAGYINLPDILTSLEGGRASQHFNFLEPSLVVGYSGNISRNKKENK
ncbi:MAG: hypothetical protein COX70_04265 [Flavobacteriales bacterium CG_4_10_14_0_2_um_filter_32_8]|nr:MAG: hypothetical protein COX70_04265 [Flavobacteriales bacterium CG_4_10_14_0_2_um_filter_32_8]